MRRVANSSSRRTAAGGAGLGRGSGACEPPGHGGADRCALDYTTILNIIALVAFAGIYWLHRRRDRFGGGAWYATDVVCGMQVEKVNAPVRADHAGTTYVFCSDRCQERFATDPARFATGTQIDPIRSDPGDEAGATDPVCGMAVDPQRAAGAADHAGRDYHFCSTGCLDAFRADPPRYTRIDTDAG